MKKHFQDLAIQCWEHTGPRLGWSRPFICLQAAPQACDILLLALDELAAQGTPAKRTLTLKQCKRRKNCSTIQILLSADTDELRQMSLTRAGGLATFEFTSSGLAKFRKGVVIWRNGGEDFAVFPEVRGRNRSKQLGKKDLESGEVWFWTPDTDP